MRFKYKARSEDGEMQQGVVDSISMEAAKEVLKRNNLTLVDLKEKKEIFVVTLILRIWERVKAREFVIFSRQLSTLIDSKVPLLAALDSIANQTSNELFALKVRSLAVDVDGGLSLSEAMEKHPETFSKFFVNMIKAGEASGTLQATLNKLADNIEKNYELTSKIKGAMYYPAFIIIAMFCVGFGMMTWVMPNLLEILIEANVELPLQTKILIATSGFLSSYWWVTLIFIALGVVGVTYYLRTEGGRREYDQIILKIPVVKTMLNNVYISRFSENLSTLIQSGLPITRALTITADVVGNNVYRQIVIDSAEEIKKGGGIADELGKNEIIPPVVVQMVQVGEQTGRVDFTLGKISDFYMKETDRMVKNFSSLIEPVIMVILGVGVFVLVSAILLPIYQIATNI